MNAVFHEGEGHDAIVVTLSRHNLQVLLAKLDKPSSTRTIMRELDPGTTLVVTAQEDDDETEDFTSTRRWCERDGLWEEV